ncbi:uncharacterized protein LOC124147367 [Haliotis rufescens]|uniref:uncharacterized protein LOC124147367 n=1 Tax=Haliotis rufescens TaxID=6454 RepID=UPI001EAFD1D4|nr:uncharacterized protein LOC124147367 [Haliotis rufescens]
MAGTPGDKNNIADGILSVIVVGCGIAFSALLGVIMRELLSLEDLPSDESTVSMLSTMPIWAVGFAYMVPGLMGLVASLVKAKGMYITHMVFCIITLLVMGVFFIIGILSIAAIAEIGVNGPGCITPGNACGIPSNIYAMSISVIIVNALGWIFTLVTTILSGILACRNENNQRFVYMQNVQPSTVTVASASSFGNQNYVTAPIKY